MDVDVAPPPTAPEPTPGHTLLAARVSAIAGGVFVLIALDVWFSGALTRFDHYVSQHVFAAIPADVAARWFAGWGSLPGDWSLLAIAFLGASVPIARRLSWSRAAVMLAAGVSGTLLAYGLKSWFERARPNEWSVVGETAPFDPHASLSFSFPSGHTFDTTLIWGLLAWYGYQAFRSGKASAKPSPAPWLVGAWAGLVLWVAAMRVLGQVHWLSDVLGGAALATAWLAGVIALDQRMGSGRLARETNREHLPIKSRQPPTTKRARHGSRQATHRAAALAPPGKRPFI